MQSFITGFFKTCPTDDPQLGSKRSGTGDFLNDSKAQKRAAESTLSIGSAGAELSYQIPDTAGHRHGDRDGLVPRGQKRPTTSSDGLKPSSGHGDHSAQKRGFPAHREVMDLTVFSDSSDNESDAGGVVVEYSPAASEEPENQVE